MGVPKAANPKLDQVVRQQLMEWFGTDVRSWELLRIYRIPYAQPLQVRGSPLPGCAQVSVLGAVLHAPIAWWHRGISVAL